jgi:hypothetical protein
MKNNKHIIGYIVAILALGACKKTAETSDAGDVIDAGLTEETPVVVVPDAGEAFILPAE